MRNWLFAVALFGVGGSAFGETVYDISETTSYFGWLDQYSLTNGKGPEACVPTSSTNAMTYLQNLAPAYFGTALTGSSYAEWLAVSTKLTTASYMDTSATSGTYYNHVPYALNKYIVTEKGFSNVSFSGMYPADYWGTGDYSKPSYMTDGSPTANFFLNALNAKKATTFSIQYGLGGGHDLLCTGLKWTDANDDGIIQKTENASLFFVDPLDPAYYDSGNLPASGPKLTSGHIWDDSVNGQLKLDYNQYSGSLPYDSASYANTGTVTIDTVFAVSVPEPSTWIMLASVFGLLAFRIRRRSRRGPSYGEDSESEG